MKRLCPLIALCAASCGPYEVKVNENTLYTPPPTIVAELADAALRDCISRTLQQSAVMAIKLKSVDCAAAGVKNLAGIDAFEALQRLNLAGNDLTGVAELASLPALREVDLSGNRQLPCAAVAALPQTLTVVAPQHCR